MGGVCDGAPCMRPRPSHCPRLAAGSTISTPPALHHLPPTCRPLIEERIRERQRLRAQNRLPPLDDLHRKPHHREGLTIPAGSLQHAI